MPIQHIADILNPNEKAIVFFTRVPEFHQNPDNTGYTGSWLLSSTKVRTGFFNGLTVIVYRRENAQSSLFRATCTEVQSRGRDGKKRLRYRLMLSGIQALGVAQDNWFDCAQTYRQDFKYFDC